MSFDSLKKKIKTRIEYVNPFGDMCVLDVPNDCNIVILAYNNGVGLTPIRLCFPHQVYVETLNNLAKQYEAKEIVAIPACSEHYISIVGDVSKSGEEAYVWTT